MGMYTGFRIVIKLPSELLDRAIALGKLDRSDLSKMDAALWDLSPDNYTQAGIDKVATPEEPRFVALDDGYVQITSGINSKRYGNLVRYLFAAGLDFALCAVHDSYFDIIDLEELVTNNPLLAQKYWDMIGDPMYSSSDINKPGHYDMQYEPGCGWAGTNESYYFNYREHKNEV